MPTSSTAERLAPPATFRDVCLLKARWRGEADMRRLRAQREQVALRKAHVPVWFVGAPEAEGARELGRRVWERCVQDAAAWPSRVCPGLYAVGDAGLGKTWCAYGAALAAVRGGASASVMTERRFLDLYAEVLRDREAVAWMGMLGGLGLLCLDDVGKADPRGRDLPRLFEIIDRRVEQGMPTVVTTQLERPDLAAWMEAASPQTAEAMASRLKRLRVMRFEGEDRRVHG